MIKLFTAKSGLRKLLLLKVQRIKVKVLQEKEVLLCVELGGRLRLALPQPRPQLQVLPLQRLNALLRIDYHRPQAGNLRPQPSNTAPLRSIGGQQVPPPDAIRLLNQLVHVAVVQLANQRAGRWRSLVVVKVMGV